jgi:hypothetical protein
MEISVGLNYGTLQYESNKPLDHSPKFGLSRILTTWNNRVDPVRIQTEHDRNADRVT